MKYFVEIIKFQNNGSEQFERRLGPYSSERVAIRADSGANYNLNHEKYYTKIVEE